MKTRMLRLLPVVILACSALVTAQSLPDVGGRPFRPTWGAGTTLRAEGADLRVFVAEPGPGDTVTLTHLNPSQLANCYGGAEKIVWVLSGVIHQPNVSMR